MTTYGKKRVVAGILTALVVAAAANWHFEFIFPRFARFIAAVTVLMMGVFALRFAPTQRDFEEHSRGRDWIGAPRADATSPPQPVPA